MSRLLGCLLLCAAAAGCGSSTTADQACTDLASARCAKRLSCGSASITRVFGDMTTCLQREKLSCVNGLAAKSTGNSPALTEMCATAEAAQSCTDFFVGNPPAICVATGALAAGASCAFNGQCASTYCTGEKLTQCGTCGPAPSGACDSTNCARGQECITDATTMASMCITPGTANGMCNRDNPCEAGLSCVGSTMTAMGTCQTAVATTGATCDPRAMMGPSCDPQQGLSCNGMSKVCQAISYVGDGMTCGTLADGSFVACSASGLCVLGTGSRMGTCKAAASDGAACDTAAGPPCLPPARCVTGGSGTAGTCQVSDASKC